MTRQDALSRHRGSVSAIRRSCGGTMMALGWAAAFLFAMLTGWLFLATAIDLVRGRWVPIPIVHFAVGLGAVTAALGFAGLGRLILGQRPSRTALDPTATRGENF